MKRGYSCVALINPKFDSNVGGVLRAMFAFDSQLLVIGGKRFIREASDTPKAHKHIPVIRSENILDCVPYNCIPIAVELKENARPINNYVHPERAFYIFGPEDGNVNTEIIKKCRDIIYIPTKICLNLAMAVNIVLFSRSIQLYKDNQINA